MTRRMRRSASQAQGHARVNPECKCVKTNSRVAGVARVAVLPYRSNRGSRAGARGRLEVGKRPRDRGGANAELDSSWTPKGTT